MDGKSNRMDTKGRTERAAGTLLIIATVAAGLSTLLVGRPRWQRGDCRAAIASWAYEVADHDVVVAATRAGGIRREPG